MSEERLQEIKDSIELQYKVQEANDLHSFNIFTDEEQELVEEIERLNKESEHLRTALNTKESIIKEAIEYIEDNIGKSNNHLYFEVLDEEIEDFLNILKGSDKEYLNSGQEEEK